MSQSVYQGCIWPARGEHAQHYSYAYQNAYHRSELPLYKKVTPENVAQLTEI